MFKSALLYYEKNRLFVNSIFSVIQVLVIGLTYFALYTIVLKKLGPVKLGTWSVVLSTSSVANIANLSISSSLVKYVATYSKSKEANEINNLIRTGLISITALMSLIVMVIYFVGFYLIEAVLPASEQAEGLTLLPLSLLSLLINAINGVFLSVLDGLHYSTLRSIVYIFSSLFFVSIGYVLLLKFGIWGVAVAQVSQACFILVTALLAIRAIFSKFKLFPIIWHKKTFKLIFSYSMNFQIMGIAQLLYDPTTKFLLSKYGNLSFVGFYEMASRLVVQIRSLIVAANQIIVPAISNTVSVNAKNNLDVKDPMYLKVYEIVFILGIPMAVLLITYSFTISHYWFGYHEPYFIYSFILLTFGYFFNLLSVPAYFSNMGIGNLKGNLVSQIFIAIANLLLGFTLGYFYDGWGVVVAWILSLMVGGVITIVYYHREHKIPYTKLLSRNQFLMLIYSLVCLVIYALNRYLFKAQENYLYFVVFDTVLFSIYVYLLFWANPLFKTLLRKITTK